jgi:uncharacterized membrane protein YgcG
VILLPVVAGWPLRVLTRPDPSCTVLCTGIDAVLAASAAAGGYRPPQPPPQYLTALALPKPKKPQRPIQPGSTPASSSSSGGGAGGDRDGGSSSGSGGARFLAYNRLGCVVSKAVDDHHVVEVCGRLLGCC